MLNKSVLIISLIIILTTTGCIKDTYDMNKLSDEAHLSPTLAISTINGNITFSELDFNLSLRIDTMMITDTIDNFMRLEESEKGNPVKPENFEKLQVIINAKNGYPLKVHLKMSPYCSSTHSITCKTPVSAVPYLEAAPVNSTGKVTGLTETTTIIDFTREFLSSIPASDKIIIRFIFCTPANGKQDVQMKPGYKIYFSASLIVKPDVDLN